jgi:hypothetical protein
MGVVIVGGYDRMVCQYKDICKEYNCKAKVFTQCEGCLADRIGTPELIVLFTNPVSHQLAKAAKSKAAQSNIPLVQSHCSSANALRNILGEQYKRDSQLVL